jgi:hypothetical protein
MILNQLFTEPGDRIFVPEAGVREECDHPWKKRGKPISRPKSSY